MIELNVAAKQDGSGKDDGMTVGELRTVLAQAERLGAVDGSRVLARVNRSLRIRSLTVQVADQPLLDDSEVGA